MTRYRPHVVIALVSFAVILYETLVTRILSVVVHYHFAFLSVSLAMLGLGAPGVWFALRPPRPGALERALLIAGAAIPLSVFAIVRFGASFRGTAAFWVACLLVPLLSLGSAVCLLLLEAGPAIGAVYGADLLGAALGVAAAMPLLHGLSTPHVVAALGALPLIAAAIVALRAPGRSTRALALLGLAALAVAVIQGAPFRLRYSKFHTELAPPLWEKWTPTARLTVFERDPHHGEFIGWGMGSRAPRRLDRDLWLDQDGGAGTPIVHYARGTPVPTHLYFDVTSAAYQLGRAGRACIIGGGGGRDILAAYGAGVPDIDAVELNRFTVEAVSQHFGSTSGDVYHLPGVHAVVGEGRTFLAGASAQYDVIQISLIDTFAASAAGAYALAENGLYTLEAFRLYLRRLGPSGVVSVSRWIEGPGALESARLAVLADEALRREGSAEPRGQIVVLVAGQVANLMAFRRPIDAQLLARVDAVADERGFVRHWPPTPRTPSTSPVAAVLVNGPGGFEKFGLDLSPPTDDRPFFFQTVDLLRPPATLPTQHDPVLLLRRVVLVLFALTVMLFALPFVARRGVLKGPGIGAGTAFFAAVGCGFMFVEVPLIHRLSLHLGHPSRGLLTVLGTMLLSAGVGSFAQGRFSDRTVRALLILLAALLGAVSLGIGPFTEATADRSLAFRITATALALAPLGFLMGVPFARGLLWFDSERRAWWWAVNGASSVLASACALAFALVIGLSNVMALGVVGYLVAALIALRRRVTA